MFIVEQRVLPASRAPAAPEAATLATRRPISVPGSASGDKQVQAPGSTTGTDEADVVIAKVVKGPPIHTKQLSLFASMKRLPPTADPVHKLGGEHLCGSTTHVLDMH